nr:MAG TPA: Smc4, Condensin complex subunit 2, SMC complex, ATPase, chromosome [Caudoviricetes sp.]
MIQPVLRPRLALVIHVYYLCLLHLYMTIFLYF